ncbi:MAG: hypothetical protein EOR92_06470 [Mesorhizobium sp.]|nr:MAG: hypothetical protein EOR02_00835 [Mesorhizobium sp.]RWP69986.1 MAG: hypothetical protein EOR07_01350 [Mesorhizobium sp.]RWQ22667.1 MAG: hypothetical protein EOR92_06470 [Mesorhizobium sp.]
MRGLDWTWDQQPGCNGSNGTERRTVKPLSCGQNVTPQIYAGTSHIVVIFPTYVRTGKMN